MTNNILFTNIFLSIYEYLILNRNIYKEWAYISIWFSLPGKFFKGKICKTLKIIYERKNISDIHE